MVGEKWQIERILGVGGMATVYQAHHVHNQRKVAIKVLHDQLCHFDDVRERFKLEAHAANRVNHRGAVPALDDGALENGTPYLVLDFLEGQSLDRRWRKYDRQLPVTEVFAITEQLLDILEAAHRNGVLHRDLKPENVFLTTEGEVKLLDFGISHITGVDRTHKTQLGSTMGTPAFMSPEQARGRWEEIDPRSEVFAVGATMYTLITGQNIHQADTANELLLAVMTEPVGDVRAMAPHVPDFAAAVINKALSFEKAGRYQSAYEMRLAVAAANAAFGNGDYALRHDDFTRLSSIPPTASQGSTHRPVMSTDASLLTESGRSKRRQGWATAALAILMTVTAAFSYFHFRTQDPVEAITFSPVAEHDGDLSGEIASQSTSDNRPGTSDGVTLEEIEEFDARRKRTNQDKANSRKWTQRIGAARVPQSSKASSTEKEEKASETQGEEAEFDPLARRR